MVHKGSWHSWHSCSVAAVLLGVRTMQWLNVPTAWRNTGTYTHYMVHKPKRRPIKYTVYVSMWIPTQQVDY